MFAVIFEVQPKQEHWNDYLGLAKELKPELEKTDGFIDNERFGSKRTEGRVLSLSTWRDEKAVVRWRIQARHHAVQEQGRFEVFADYHLRVGEITGDTSPPQGLPLIQQRLDETAVGKAKAVTITELTPKPKSGLHAATVPAHLGLDTNAPQVVDHELFESIYTPGKLLLLVSWTEGVPAGAWRPNPFPAAASLRHRRVRIIRDYGMFDRREAPQFYPDAAPPR